MESLIRHSCFVNKSVFQRCIIKASVNIFLQSYFHRDLSAQNTIVKCQVYLVESWCRRIFDIVQVRGSVN